VLDEAPYIGFPFLIWAALTKQVEALLTATALVLGGLFVFVARTDGHVVGAVASYWRVLTTLYVGENRTADVGAIGFRPVIHALINAAWLADAVHVVVMGALLIWLCRVALSARRALAGTFDIALIALLSVWALMAFYNRPYSKLLILPGMMWLMFGDHSTASWRDLLALAYLQGCLVTSFAWRSADWFTLRLTMGVLPDEPAWLSFVIRHFSRGMVVVLLGYLVLRIKRVEVERAY
jgi:hypothetical protein